MSSTNPDVQLSEEELERKKKKEEKAKEKELKKQKAAQKAAEAAKLKAQQGSNSSKASKKPGRADAGDENVEDFIDPETTSGEKKKLSKQMAKQFSPEAVEKSYDGMHGGSSQVSLRQIPLALNLCSQSTQCVTENGGEVGRLNTGGGTQVAGHTDVGKLEGRTHQTNAHQANAHQANAALMLNSLSHIIDKLACEV